MVTMTHDGSGGYWIFVSGVGLYRLKDGNWTKYLPAPELPRAEAVKRCPGSGPLIAFTDHANRVWLGCTKGQLAVIDGEKETSFGEKEGVQAGNITAIDARGSALWIGGEFGLQRYEKERFHSIQGLDPEALRGISGIVETADGDLWLNGLGGIVHIGRAEIVRAIKDPLYRVSSERFDRRAGLPGSPSQVRQMPTAIEGSDGRLWFSVSGGVVWLDPKRRSARLPAPPVSIQSVSADSERYELDQPLRFPAGTSSVQIGYAAVSLLHPDSIRFRYRLQGVDDDWRDAGTQTSVSYRSLPPGAYRFEVDASDANGIWSGKAATAQFSILPAYYQTNWFRVLCAALVLAMFWMAYRLRVRHLQRRFEMTLLAEEKLREKDDALETARTELARVSRLTTLGELTTSIAHEVSQPLSAIVASAGACARWLAADPPALAEARSTLDNIVADGKRAREVIARIRALTKRQALRMDLLDLNREILEVLALTEQELTSHDVVLRTQLHSTLPPVRGDRVQLQQVLLNLIVNATEAMSAVNDRPRELTIVSAQDTGGVVVEVRDSGIGLDQAHAERVFDAFYTTKAEGLGIGLSISRSIVEAHGGRLWAAPNQPHGAVFGFSLPAAENGQS
jgi:signal transduction histidine kinase